MENRNIGVMVNYDCNVQARFGSFAGGSLTKENAESKLKAFADEFCVDGADNIILCIFCQGSSVPSRLIDFKGDKYTETVQNGVKVDWKNIPDVSVAYKLTREYGIEPFSFINDYLKEKGMRTWISFRMNDCHFGGDEASWGRDKFFYTVKKNGWFVGKKYGYYATCFDYSYPEVRKYFLDYIKEQLDIFDVFGVEWDFTREFMVFDYVNDPECHKIMTGFMKELKQAVVCAEKKWGHEIKINVRVLRDIEHDKIFGFDVKTWAEMGLVDIVTVCPRFEIIDCDLPIAQWKEALKDTGVLVYAGLEQHNYAYTPNDTSSFAGYARKYYDEGADGIYAFNMFYMFNPWYVTYKEDIAAISSRENTASVNDRFVVTYQDIYPEGCSRYKPLPFSFTGEKEISFKTGKYAKNTRIKLYIAHDDPDISVKINGVNARRLSDASGALVPVDKKTEKVYMYTQYENTEMYAYEAVCDASDGVETITLSSDKETNISYIEFYFAVETQN